ncbi:HD-GYP domain-containing protein [Bacillus sp. 31A1R]|uniref:HD-GYP domain-containing protein n=2 Tax=Robertmurraya mangrovi TaxID=3098077 RepID=A0ABU5J195_9BACI|nr:HD-GYP domain-containing protein [Bacillus sp. 31A1R]
MEICGDEVTKGNLPLEWNNNRPLTLPEIDHILHSMKINQVEYNFDHKTNVNSKVEIKKISREIDLASKQMEDIFKHIGRGGDVPLSEIKKDILPTIKQAAEIPHLYHLFYELNSKDEYTYRHMICVGIIATMIGRWINLPKEELEHLTLGATLHDVGKTKISNDILNKPGKLTKEEYETMKLHTMYGYELLKGIKGLDERVAIVALQHHEREDGGGYPFRLVNRQIDIHSKIVAIADVFHAMSSARVYHKAAPLHVVIKQMQEDAFGKLDPNILLVFLYKMMNSLTGKQVQLTNGAEGTIIMIHPYDPLRSLVRVEDTLIDLRYNKHLQIEKVLEDNQ